jgi:hypothetical protein
MSLKTSQKLLKLALNDGVKEVLKIGLTQLIGFVGATRRIAPNELRNF